jgi:hypothetical protein
MPRLNASKKSVPMKDDVLSGDVSGREETEPEPPWSRDWVVITGEMPYGLV